MSQTNQTDLVKGLIIVINGLKWSKTSNKTNFWASAIF